VEKKEKKNTSCMKENCSRRWCGDIIEWQNIYTVKGRITYYVLAESQQF
jgi:hypothetical protein